MAHGRVSGAIFVDAAVFVDDDQSLGIEVELTVEPGYAAAQDIGALLLLRRCPGGNQPPLVFLKRDGAPVEETAHNRRGRSPHASLNGKALPDLGQG